MKVTAIKTDKVYPNRKTIFEVLDENIKSLEEASVLAVTSKIVSLCESRVVPLAGNDRDELVKREADLYLPRRLSKWNFELTITGRTLVMSAGIDKSNAGGDYFVLWPEDPRRSAEQIWQHLRDKFRLEKLGIIITDSTTTPLRWGTTGVAIAYCGFEPKNSYIGQPDVFGHKLEVSQSNIAGGLATAAVLCMGEGREQTPMALLEQLPMVKFQARPPLKKELDEYFVTDMNEDVFQPFLKGANWQKGRRGTP